MMSVPDQSSAGGRGFRVLVREPLVHFLVLGVLLFVVFEFVHPSSDADSGGKEIRVDREAILNFLQYRSNAFQFDLFNEQLDALSPRELQAVVDAYVREEVLHRESLAMGLDQGDYIIRQRLVQKLEFLIEGTAEAALQPTLRQLEDFYALHETDYKEPPVYTFSHVFFDREVRGEDAARQAAAALVELNRASAPSSSASRWGDRPLFFQHYVERTRDFVVSYLGEDLAVGLDAVPAPDAVWRGPFPSPYGWHVVLLGERRSERLPDLGEIEERVVEDYMRIELDRAQRRATEQLVADYDVEIVGLGIE